MRQKMKVKNYLGRQNKKIIQKMKKEVKGKGDLLRTDRCSRKTIEINYGRENY